MAKPATATWLNKIAKEKTKLLQEMFDMEPIHVDVKDPITKKVKPHTQGEDIVYHWEKIYSQDKVMQGIVVETVTGPSTPGKDYVDDIKANPVFPYEQIRALLGDGGRWKWPEIYKKLVRQFITRSAILCRKMGVWKSYHILTFPRFVTLGFVATPWSCMAPY
jgi:hypothetical protein